MKKKKLTNNKVIVLSIVIGAFVALIIGYTFPYEYDVYDGIKVHLKDTGYSKNDYSEFNCLLAFGSFIITLGIFYLLLMRNNALQKEDNNELEEKENNSDWDLELE